MKFTYTSGSRPLDGYTIKRGIGHGGFGEVYYAVSDGGKEVALKLVQRNLEVELRGVAQCMNLKHPNLVTLYDLRTNDVGEHWVVMEFVSGKSLSELLEEQKDGMPMDEVHRWFRGICAGIGYLHDKGIVHRDLKPGNLFIEDGVVKVGDYGLSKFITASRRSGQTESVGTVHYMAPEISRGKYDREIDIYATGIILYEMITGHVPFDGESVGEILMKHLTAQPDVTKLPTPYDQVAMRALAKDPTERFRTMEQLAAGLNGRLVEGPKLRETMAFVPPDPDATTRAADGSSPNPVEFAAAAAPLRPSLDKTHDWFARMRDKAIAWYDRPWTAKDYILAVVCLGVFGTAIPHLLSIVPVLVPALVAAGVIMLVMKATKKRGTIQPAPGGSPVVLNPIVVPPAVAPNPVVSTTAVVPVPPAVFSPSAMPLRMVPLRPSPRELPPKPARTRLVEATTAMLLTTVMAIVASVLAAGVMRLEKIEECELLAATTLAGCWAVLIPAKIWEGQNGDAMLRRLAMAALGLGVGIWCSFLDGVLQVGWLNDLDGRPLLFQSMEWMPKLLTDASYFGLVFLLPRWWLLADSRRPLRFNPWMVIVPSFWAWLITLLWSHPYEHPHYWGVIVTAMMAALVQLALPWEDSAAARRRMV